MNAEACFHKVLLTFLFLSTLPRLTQLLRTGGYLLFRHEKYRAGREPVPHGHENPHLSTELKLIKFSEFWRGEMYHLPKKPVLPVLQFSLLAHVFNIPVSFLLLTLQTCVNSWTVVVTAYFLRTSCYFFFFFSLLPFCLRYTQGHTLPILCGSHITKIYIGFLSPAVWVILKTSHFTFKFIHS